MNTKRKLSGVVLVAGLVIAAWAYAQMGMSNDGVRFPDGTIQTTAGSMQTPVQVSGSFSICDGCLGGSGGFVFEVPDATMLTIEYVSLEISDLPDGDSLDASVSVTVDGTTAEHYLGVAAPIERPAIDPTEYNYRYISKQVKFYASPNTGVGVTAWRLSRAGVTYVQLTLSGYLVDAP